MTSVSVRYFVHDVDAAIDFYTRALGFALAAHPTPGFATLTSGPLRLLLNEPGTGGAGEPLLDGRTPEPGGWNRIQLEVSDISGEVERLRQAGARFRGQIIDGRDGREIALDDPSGNAIELFEPH